ncbi:MAG: hypothetical protein K6A63_08745 [Acholeplasmatales bacterium]|nr:hypothetical protein [Acholeplasmatales bacterium]
MAQVTVTIKVSAKAEKVYICGSTKNLGDWNPKNAVEVKDGKINKKFDADTVVEFKVLSAKTWDAVEKGVNGEELENHKFTVSSAVKEFEVVVDNFAA